MATANESIPAAATCQGFKVEVIGGDFVRRLITVPVTCHDAGLKTRTSP
jgi:thiamine monophosphate kinase